ncbi:hypothetical protein MCOR27_000291 [Pyricularia oryzae]|uniref:Glyoxylate reductase n=2 Tax=Pyricularia TaxID=48558 RepID=A0ABQ8NZ29_PYRGI|nr:hypothetical protein MCOR02_009716 [Pyricularia oryzae]KAI6304209.1 hypothetical protein MCOR33_000723 [Pyricularia grisea]KAI6285872.1 hypothetical protein MCOR26_001247 [Pyricularia oryzae]KAI6289254.1 hypothetical protein MCOR27_000291 [Pyricularia oryzae]KAI6323093.1 hypothetical protein MCOR34_001995 [Pyricularia oryzae]
MLPLISCLLALCPLAVLAGPAPELQKRSITCLKIGDNATATWKNAAGQTCTFTGVVGSNFGTNPAGTGDYSCNGRCGAGCSGSSLGNAYTQDCFSHDMCSFFNNASGGESDPNCGAAFKDAVDDTAFGTLRGCGESNPNPPNPQGVGGQIVMSWMFRMYKFADSERANSEKSQFFKVGWAKVMDDSGPGAHDRRGREEHRRLDLWYLGSSTGTCPDWKPPMTPSKDDVYMCLPKKNHCSLSQHRPKVAQTTRAHIAAVELIQEAASLADYSVSELIPPSYFPKMAGESTGTRPKVLLLGTIDHADEAWSKLSAKADIVTPTSTDRASFLAECASGAFAGVVAAYRTFVSGRTTGRIDAELLAALPPTLRFICHNGAGYDQIDVAACTAAGVRVSNTPSAVDDATADAGIFLMLGALRNFGPGMQSCRNGEWIGKPAPALGHDPRGKVLGILGMGGIGRNMAKKAAVFGMKIRYYNRTRLSAELEADCGAEYVDFDTLLATSDVLSLNLPLNPKTRHTISHAEFAKMKTGVVVVNTARGAVMDEAALVAALDSGRVASAGLDVYEEEPKVHPGLLANHRCLLVPHMGTYTEETQTKMEEVAISNIVAALEKGQLVTGVPEQSGLTF